MSITKESELAGMKEISDVVALTLKEMRNHAHVGMSAKELDEFGGKLLKEFGAKSAPRLAYGFPGHTCISINNEIAHGVPTDEKILHEGDLINIDVSAELNGFWSDNGGSFVLGTDVHHHSHLIETSKAILKKAISNIHGGVRIADIGKIIETEAKRSGYKVIRNLTGHGIGRELHEEPHEIANYFDRSNTKRFRKNSVVAIETFISTASNFAETQPDAWTLKGNKGGFVAQHEHTILVTDSAPVILTAENGIWD